LLVEEAATATPSSLVYVEPSVNGRGHVHGAVDEVVLLVAMDFTPGVTQTAAIITNCIKTIPEHTVPNMVVILLLEFLIDQPRVKQFATLWQFSPSPALLILIHHKCIEIY